MQDTLAAYVDAATASGYAEDWDLETLWNHLKVIYPISFVPADLDAELGGRVGLDVELLKHRVLEDLAKAYSDRESALSSEVTRELERKVLLSVLDRKWR